MQNKLSAFIRITAVALIVAIFYCFVGYRLVYSFVIHDAKQDAEFAIHHESNLTAMTLSATEYNALKWTEKNKEFSLNKQLYDVVSMQKSGSSYVMQVYADKNETQWVEAMNDFVRFIFSADTNKKTNHAESLLSAFQKEYTPLQKLRIVYSPMAKTTLDSEVVSPSSSLLIKPIWHPPAC